MRRETIFAPRDGIGVTARFWGVVLLGLAALACNASDPVPHGDAAVWITTDGRSWSRVHDPDLGGEGAQQMTGVTELGGLVVAVGTRSLEGEDDGGVWISDDGRDWRTVHDPDLVGPGNQWLNAVAVVGSRLIAVGGSDEGGDADVLIWTSPDGIEWDKVVSPELGGAGSQTVWPHGNPLAVRDELMVLVGINDEQATVWTSRDARTWSEVEKERLGDTEGSGGWTGVIAGGPGLVAVGSTRSDAGVWTSPDGLDWTMAAGAVPDDYGVQRMVGIVETERGFVAFGDTLAYEEIYFLGRGTRSTSDIAVWTSEDGRQWRRVDDPEDLSDLGDQHVFAAAGFGSSVFVVGMDSPDPRTGGLVDAGPASGRDVDAAVWMSRDGRDWDRVRSESFGGEDWQDMFDLVEFEGALVVVGGDDAATSTEN